MARQHNRTAAKSLIPVTALGLAALLTSVTPSAAETVRPNAPLAMSPDSEVTINGIAAACTGIGAETRGEARWTSYGVRVEFSNSRNEYLTGGAVGLYDPKGRELLNVSCDAPWILLRLSPGSYRVEGRMPDSMSRPRSARFNAPAHGQLRVVLQFLDL